MTESKKILVCPLDWGLGHATRCIPIIKKLLASGCEVYIAGTGRSLDLLRNEFPTLKWFYLPGYRVKYAAKPFLFFSLLLQMPFFLISVLRENYLIRKIQRRERFHVIISDNRYGLFTSLAKTVFITHQLNIILPGWLKLIEGILKRLVFSVVRHYDHCWIPDIPGSIYSGQLSVPGENMGKISYIGLLSRFSRVTDIKFEDLEYEVVGIISGPEPSRTRFEEILEQQLAISGMKSLLIRGLPDNSTISQRSNLFMVDYLPPESFLKVLEGARYIICRSGYSSIMDLVILKKRALLVPTPGQTEQEYLARHLNEAGIFPFIIQKEFDLGKAVEMLNSSNSIFPPLPEYDFLKEALNKLLKPDL